MQYTDKEIELIINKLKPKILNSLNQTNIQNREDLKQELIEMIIKGLKNNKFEDVPGFFELTESD